MSTRSSAVLLTVILAVSGRLHADPLSLAETLAALERDSRTWTAASASLESASLTLRRAHSVSRPTIEASLPLSADHLLDGISVRSVNGSSTEIRQRNAVSGRIAPEITMSQVLPTAGTLSASLSNTIGVSRLGSVEPDSVTPFLPRDEQPDLTVRFGVRLDQPLFFGDAFGASLALAGNLYGRAELENNRVRNELAYDAARRFWRLQYLAFYRSLVVSRHAAAEARLTAAVRERELGVLTESGLLRARLAYARAEIDRFDAEKAYDDEYAAFGMRYGFGTDREIRDRVEAIGIDFTAEMLEYALSENLDLARMRLEVNNAANEIVLHDKDRAPRLSVNAGVAFIDQSEENRTDRSTTISGGVRVTVKLYDGGAGDLRRGELERAALSRALELEERVGTIRAELMTALESLDRNDRYALYLRTAEEISTYEYEKGKKDRELGVITDRDLQELELELEAARLRLQESIMEDNLLRLRIVMLSGGDIVGTVRGSEKTQ